MFKEAYSNWLICYCAPLGLGSRPVIATGDKRPASIVLGDHYSKQFRGELINRHHHEGNIKLLNDVNFLISNLHGLESLLVSHVMLQDQ